MPARAWRFNSSLAHESVPVSSEAGTDCFPSYTNRGRKTVQRRVATLNRRTFAIRVQEEGRDGEGGSCTGGEENNAAVPAPGEGSWLSRAARSANWPCRNHGVELRWLGCGLLNEPHWIGQEWTVSGTRTRTGTSLSRP